MGPVSNGYNTYHAFAKLQARYGPRKRVNFKNLARDECFYRCAREWNIHTLAQSRFNQSPVYSKLYLHFEILKNITA